MRPNCNHTHCKDRELWADCKRTGNSEKTCDQAVLRRTARIEKRGQIASRSEIVKSLKDTFVCDRTSPLRRQPKCKSNIVSQFETTSAVEQSPPHRPFSTAACICWHCLRNRATCAGDDMAGCPARGALLVLQAAHEHRGTHERGARRSARKDSRARVATVQSCSTMPGNWGSESVSDNGAWGGRAHA